jgi:uncharacterized protein YbbK (DUF523 family)
MGGISYASVNVSFLDLWRKVKCGVMWNALSYNIAERGLVTVSTYVDFGSEMEKVLISACLLGKRVWYDGNGLSVYDSILEQWKASGRVISICPEVDAGMSIPRAPAEILKGDGCNVWEGTALVVEDAGIEVTEYFKKGAQMALELCKKHNIKVAVLTENSPSCGSSVIYDGSFTSKKIDGVGVTAALLKNSGIAVFSQHNIESASKELQRTSR